MAFQNDWNSYFTGTKEGDIVDLGNGAKVTRMGDGSAVYQDAGGAWVQYNQNSDPNQVASQAAGLANNWGQTYASEAPVAQKFTDQSSFESWLGKAQSGAKFSSDYQVPDWYRMTGLSLQDSDKSAAYSFFKNNPQYAADYERILQGGKSQYATDGSTLVKTDLSSLSPETRAYYEANPNALAMAEGFSFDPTLYHLNQTGQIQSPKNSSSSWLQNNRWTPNGMVASNNGLLYANAGTAGKYNRNLYDTTTGKIIDTPVNPGQINWGNGTSGTPVGATGGSVTGGGATGVTGGSSGGTGVSGSSSTSSTSSSTSIGGNPTMGTVTAPMTVEGRIGGLLTTDTNGNYTNQVVRQASDRAMQSFASRGLLNSSMAVQAAQEAAISKAVEIAGPDAKTTYDQSRANQDASNQFALNATQFQQELAKMKAEAEYTIQRMTQEFTQSGTTTDKANAAALRNNYITSVQQATVNYTNRINQINASNMSPEDKNAAALEAAQDRDGELAFTNRMYTSMPGWSSEWGSVAVPTQGVDLSTISNVTTLSNIAEDPAQPQATRDAAKARIAAINAAPKLAAEPAKTPVTTNASL